MVRQAKGAVVDTVYLTMPSEDRPALHTKLMLGDQELGVVLSTQDTQPPTGWSPVTTAVLVGVAITGHVWQMSWEYSP
jgi:hypothetical protein